MTTSETYAFSADINQLLSLIINAIYSNKEIFLRELLSNASDALNKVRYENMVNGLDISSEPNFEIRISLDKKGKRMIIKDTGIGMSREELIHNLGTIASSGTKSFLETIRAGADLSLIGQFGVGFYSAFLVADKVTVYSKSSNSNVNVWESMAGGSFQIREDEENVYGLIRGTAIVLHMKEDMEKYMEEGEIRNLIKKHNQFVDFPIHMEIEMTRDVTNEESGESQKETYYQWEHMNIQKPIWTRNPKEVTQEEYDEFYRAVYNDFEGPLHQTHFSVEGQLEFKGLIYIPKRAPFDMFDNGKKPTNVKLYVRKIFITDNCEELVPDYLRFVKGVIDSEDLPLNISREMLQQNKIMKVIKKNIVKRCLDMFSDLMEDETKYLTFYEQFSKNLKLGVHEDTNNREKIASLLRYETTMSDGILSSLDDYIGRISVSGQKSIYYITGESKRSVENSPFLEKMRKKNIEVIYMVDPIDEYIVQQLKEYKEYSLVCITKENSFSDDEDKEFFEALKKDYENVCTYIKNLLNDQVEKVVCTNRLENSPCVLTTSEYGWTANMQRIMKAQALRTTGQDMSFMMGKKTMEINPKNRIIQRIKEKLDNHPEDSKMVNDLIHLLYEITVQSSGFTLDNPAAFSERILKLIQLGLGMNDDNEEEIYADMPELIDVDESSEMERVD